MERSINTAGGKLVFFSESRIELQKELPHHPELVALLQNHPVAEFEVRLAEISAYVGIALHGDYLPEDLDDICEMCRHKLWKMRSPIHIASMSDIRRVKQMGKLPSTKSTKHMRGLH